LILCEKGDQLFCREGAGQISETAQIGYQDRGLASSAMADHGLVAADLLGNLWGEKRG
jgi:hypothetical protein